MVEDILARFMHKTDTRQHTEWTVTAIYNRVRHGLSTMAICNLGILSQTHRKDESHSFIRSISIALSFRYFALAIEMMLPCSVEE